MKLKKLSQNNKAITLIALVVTIIVLLILAGISIIMLTGQNGILNRAKEAKEATRGGDVQDIVRMEIAHNTAADYTGGTKKSKEQVINELYQSGKITPNGSETPWTDPTDETITSGALEYGRITN